MGICSGNQLPQSDIDIPVRALSGTAVHGLVQHCPAMPVMSDDFKGTVTRKHNKIKQCAGQEVLGEK
jgi:hypothetical protein